MESKQQLLETIEKAEPQRREYLKSMFQYVPDAIVKAMSCKTFQKEEYFKGTALGQEDRIVWLLWMGRRQKDAQPGRNLPVGWGYPCL